MYINYTTCCGLDELHGLRGDSQAELDIEFKASVKKWPKTQVFATTIPTMVAAIKWLKSKKFVEVKTWLNPNSKREVTLWLRK